MECVRKRSWEEACDVVTNANRDCFSVVIPRWKDRRTGCWVYFSRTEASPELRLSSTMCKECEFFGLDSDEDVWLSLFSKASIPEVASGDSAWCVEECCLSGKETEWFAFFGAQ